MPPTAGPGKPSRRFEGSTGESAKQSRQERRNLIHPADIAQAQSSSWPPASSNTVPAVGKSSALLGKTEAEVSAQQPGVQVEHDVAAGGPPVGVDVAAGDVAAAAAATPAMGRQMGPGLRRATARAPARACRWGIQGRAWGVQESGRS